MEPKVIRKNPLGYLVVECPVCKMPYLEHGLNNHLSQMAGKEAQYEMARLVYQTIQDHQTAFLAQLSDTLDHCPHWKYLLDNPKVMPDTKPVCLKERYRK